jgi:hypothetical protein
MPNFKSVLKAARETGVLKTLGKEAVSKTEATSIKTPSLLTGLTVGGAAMLSNPQESQAMPPGVFKKIGKKSISGALSSASEVLAGQEIEGRTITKVLKGRGDWRRILFDDDTEMTVKKQYINDLCRALGTKKYINKFSQQEGDSKTLQAIKSLKYHYSRAHAVPRTYTRHLHQKYLTRAAEMSQDLPPDTVFVTYHGKFFTMPKEYAEHLEDLGYVTIRKTRRDLQKTKPARKVKRKKKK